MAYILFVREDIPASVLQINDLWPNASLWTPGNPVPQGPQYVRPQVTSAITLRDGAGNSLFTVRDAVGLAAYAIDRISGPAPGSATLTPTQAGQISDNILGALQDGLTLDLDAINAAINAAVTGSSLNNGGSTGDVEEVLQILAGRTYLLPAGSRVGFGNAFDSKIRGSFTTPIRALADTDSLAISFHQGNISKFRASTFTYLGVTGAAIAVYNNDGTLYV